MLPAHFDDVTDDYFTIVENQIGQNTRGAPKEPNTKYKIKLRKIPNTTRI